MHASRIKPAKWNNLMRKRLTRNFIVNGCYSSALPLFSPRIVVVLLSASVCLLLTAAQKSSSGGIRFSYQAIPFRLENDETHPRHIPAAMAGGVAVFDFNKDGRPDIFFTNGANITTLKKDSPKFSNRLFRNDGSGKFTDVTRQAGLEGTGYDIGVAVGDYDNDGYPDLFVAGVHRNTLYHNNGDGTFTDVTQKAGVAAGGWSASAGFFDYDNDGKLDLFVTRYMQWDTQHSKACVKQTYCPPAEFPTTTNILYHNLGNGKFEDVSEKSGIAGKEGRSLGLAFNDYDGDGYADIIVANDAMEQFLFHNNGNGTFTERALDAGVALTDDGKPFSGMGVDFRDYDNDGRPDIVITDLAKQMYALFHNDGNGAFSYRSLQTGLGALSAGSSGWGVRLEDFDNDGWKDLFVAQSHVMDNVEQIDPSLHYKQPPLLALNHQARFEAANPGMSEPVAGRGAAFGDLNNDGWTDVVMTVLGGEPIVFHNRPGNAHWLTITLEGVRSNRDGLGARVVANGQTQYCTTAGSYLSASDQRVHFGLGTAEKADIEVFWPSGIHQKLTAVPANQFLHIREAETKP